MRAERADNPHHARQLGRVGPPGLSLRQVGMMTFMIGTNTAVTVPLAHKVGEVGSMVAKGACDLATSLLAGS